MNKPTLAPIMLLGRADLQDTYFDALEILKRESGDRVDIASLIRGVKFELLKEHAHIAHMTAYKDKLVTVHINPIILTYPRIERVEFFLSFALEIWRFRSEMSWAEFRQWCTRLGCDYSNSIHPRERWRWIMALPGAEKFALLELDDRPKCEYCEGSMPTGSDCHPERKGVHENCGYELDALLEAIKKEGGLA